jgi:hypothetical protein
LRQISINTIALANSQGPVVELKPGKCRDEIQDTLGQKRKRGVKLKAMA